MTGAVYYPDSNRTGCDTYSPAEAAKIAGKVVIVDRTDACDSYILNVRAAGAIGAIVVDDRDVFDLSPIFGSRFIPVVTMPKNGWRYGQARSRQSERALLPVVPKTRPPTRIVTCPMWLPASARVARAAVACSNLISPRLASISSRRALALAVMVCLKWHIAGCAACRGHHGHPEADPPDMRPCSSSRRWS